MAFKPSFFYEAVLFYEMRLKLLNRLRIVVRSDSFGLVVSLNSRNSCHSEKTENLASSVDFRLIQNLSMLIFYYSVNIGGMGIPTYFY